MPVVIGEAQAALRASKLLEAEGFLAVAIRPPTVPEGTARLRLSFSAAHPDAEIARLASVVRTRVLANRMSAVFITATGTDIGKTFVAAGLIRHMRGAGQVGRRAQAGGDRVRAVGHRSKRFRNAAGRARPAGRASADSTASRPGGLPRRCRPDMAARRENRPIKFDDLLEYCRRAVTRHDGTLLIEGVGGVMVPLDGSHTVLDWMAALRIPAILVTGSYLGTLSHTLTALDALRRQYLEIKAIIVNETPGSTVPIEETAQTLTRFAGRIALLTLPRLSRADAGHAVFARIAALIA